MKLKFPNLLCEPTTLTCLINMHACLLGTFCFSKGKRSFCLSLLKLHVYQAGESRHHNSMKLWILLPLRADLFCTLQCETPCTCYLHTKYQLSRLLKTGQYCITFYTVPIRECGVYSFILPQHFLTNTQYFEIIFSDQPKWVDITELDHGQHMNPVCKPIPSSICAKNTGRVLYG